MPRPGSSDALPPVAGLLSSVWNYEDFPIPCRRTHNPHRLLTGRKCLVRGPYGNLSRGNGVLQVVSWQTRNIVLHLT